MKNLKNIIIFLILNLFLNLQILICQEGQNETSYKDIYITDYLDFESKLRLNKSANGIDNVAYSSIDGDPYIYKDFVTGNLKLKAGENIPLDLRYDIYKGEIQFRQKDGIYALINQESVSEVLIDTLRFIYLANPRPAPVNGPAESSWFIVRADGKCQLLIRKNIRLQAATTEKPYQEAHPAKFIHTKDTYYLRHESKSEVKVTAKKDLLNVLSDKEDEVSNYIEINKLGVKDLDDLVKIISFYNGL